MSIVGQLDHIALERKPAPQIVGDLGLVLDD
jgi:hypothetical protein